MHGAVDFWMGTLSQNNTRSWRLHAGVRSSSITSAMPRAVHLRGRFGSSVAAGALEAFNGDRRLKAQRSTRSAPKRRTIHWRFCAPPALTRVTRGAPIVPIHGADGGSRRRMTKFCQTDGVFVLPVLPPAVPKGQRGCALMSLRPIALPILTLLGCVHAADVPQA